MRVPYVLAAVFVVVTQTLSLAQFLPVSVAVLVGSAWAVLVCFAASRIVRRPRLSARAENVLIFSGIVLMGVFAFGGAVGILMLNTALDSGSVTGETMMAMFATSIPIAIAANVPTELIVVPLLLVLCWRPGARRVSILVAAGLYLALRIWTYLVFAGDRLDFEATAHSTAVLSPAERRQFAHDWHLDDPRWAVNLAIFAVLLLAAFQQRARPAKDALL